MEIIVNLLYPYINTLCSNNTMGMTLLKVDGSTEFNLGTILKWVVGQVYAPVVSLSWKIPRSPLKWRLAEFQWWSGHFVYLKNPCCCWEPNHDSSALDPLPQLLYRLHNSGSNKNCFATQRKVFLSTWVRASWIEFNNWPTRCYLFSLLHFCRQLYMFRVLTPIIRSSYNCNYSFWYW